MAGGTLVIVGVGLAMRAWLHRRLPVVYWFARMTTLLQDAEVDFANR